MADPWIHYDDAVLSINVPIEQDTELVPTYNPEMTNMLDAVWTVDDGYALPAGLEIASWNGHISGIPTESFDGDIRIKCTWPGNIQA